MLKKLFAPLLLTVFCLCTMQAQENLSNYFVPERGYVYLKNGEVLKGKYIYSPELDKIRVMTRKESLVFDVSEVDRVSKEKPEKSGKANAASFDYLPGRMFNLNELGLLIGNSENNIKNPFLFHSSLNYWILPALAVGLGTGVEIYKEVYLPAFVNFMYKFSGNSRITPYAMLQGGYEIPIERSRMQYADVVSPPWSSVWFPVETTDMKAKGGFLVHPSVGFLYQLGENFGMGLSVGYRHHALRYRANEDYSLDVKYNRLSVKLSFVFN